MVGKAKDEKKLILFWNFFKVLKPLLVPNRVSKTYLHLDSKIFLASDLFQIKCLKYILKEVHKAINMKVFTTTSKSDKILKTSSGLAIIPREINSKYYSNMTYSTRKKIHS